MSIRAPSTLTGSGECTNVSAMLCVCFITDCVVPLYHLECVGSVSGVSHSVIQQQPQHSELE